jgi:[ribosomal protein S18]-alanine N-acetyltransferase
MTPMLYRRFIFPRPEMSQTLPFRIEPMTLADIPQVLAVEQASYTMQWPRKAYEHELTQNKLAHYFVLRATLPNPQPSNLIGMTGFWLMADEAHISTLAVHPAWRRHGLGEWLLLHLLEQAQVLGAIVATLEVRPSNQAALGLYQKYDFQEQGRRVHYYSDNGEDALIFTTPLLAALDYQTMLAQRRVALSARLAQFMDKDQQA